VLPAIFLFGLCEAAYANPLRTIFWKLAPPHARGYLWGTRSAVCGVTLLIGQLLLLTIAHTGGAPLAQLLAGATSAAGGLGLYWAIKRLAAEHHVVRIDEV
jgi:hypothetical protein